MTASDYDRSEWLSCPECDSARVDVETTGGYESSIAYDCRNCGAGDAYWL